jgi:hypothetical protein
MIFLVSSHCTLKPEDRSYQQCHSTRYTTKPECAAETFSTTLPELLSLFIHADLSMFMKELLLAKAWGADLK